MQIATCDHIADALVLPFVLRHPLQELQRLRDEPRRGHTGSRPRLASCCTERGARAVVDVRQSAPTVLTSKTLPGVSLPAVPFRLSVAMSFFPLTCCSGWSNAR